MKYERLVNALIVGATAGAVFGVGWIGCAAYALLNVACTMRSAAR